ncbi:MAG TPA: LacI family DNA-binding transcriptional regulator [Aggregatilinea sp.]|uniref:LacI family DNA-binding transcriptional regulator n=1 Tax=Aggregatilinea sp. TaxID=2806333 RepID=UPI002CD1C900|nr:LacI family DNA-binding transcriptional regulator [Aggregatilinea sp.]HML20937.1 LacI family DNA-binding transcriptional regulator [Aggregatilinea sp.]
MARKKVTSKDVAKAAGVSQATVSYVLNNVDRANISEKTRLHVQQIARDLGYTPNVVARSLVQGRSINIGMALFHPHEQIFIDSWLPNILTGFGSVIQQYGFRLLVERVNDKQQYESIINLLHGHEVAGMVVQSTLGSEFISTELINQGIPVVIFGSLSEHIHYSVSSDNLTGVRTLINHLIGLGHQRIACISYAPEGTVEHASDRLTTYYETLAAAGISPDPSLVRFGAFDPFTGYEAMRDLLRCKPRPTAVFGMNDTMAIAAMAAIQEAGLRVPEDIAVVGFDDDRFAAFTTPSLTTIHESQREIGHHAGEMLIDLLNDVKPAVPNLILPTQLVVRKSCGAHLTQQDLVP